MNNTQFGGKILAGATLVAFLIEASTFSLGAQTASFQGVGDLPGGTVESAAYAVSADGRTIVGSSVSSNGVEAFRWRDGVMTGLGSLPGSTFGSRANGVSGDGSVIVGRSRSSLTLEGFRWENGTMVGLGTIPGYASSAALGVARDGHTIIGHGYRDLQLNESLDDINYTAIQAALWTNGVPVALGDLPGGPFDSASGGPGAINANGTIILGRSRTEISQTYEACRWINGEIGALGFLPGGLPYSMALAISGDGAAIVGRSSSARSTQGSDRGEACRWDGGVPSGLGDLPGGDFDSIAWGVSDDGEVIIGTGTSSTRREAFVWDRVNGIRPLKEVLESLQLNLNGWTLDEAFGISADGTVITGTGTHDGTPEGWIAKVSRTELINGLGTRMTVKVACLDICWNSKTNKAYQIQYKSNLTADVWTDLGLPIPGNGTINCITDSVSGIEKRYYQVVEQP